ncbi:MAG TPA: hypothetical protein PKW35_00195 [Nannocystaceae bacterium]|nr:hypothetical protein [Nannocystaceae bacterium]
MKENEIPRAVLSEHLQGRMKDRRLLSAVFTTYCIEPGFFETEVLPVFFDIPLSHASAIKLVQLEDALRSLPGSIAVYFDQHGLIPSGGGARLDIRRFPVRHPTGLFHPKNVLALVEGPAPEDGGPRPKALLVACMSANLTRAGWWENVEVAHVEEIAEGDHTALRDSLLTFLDDLIKGVEGRRLNDDLRARHQAIFEIRTFLRGTSQREHRSTKGRLHPHFDGGETSLADFVEGVAGASLRGLCLEVLSPYFDGGDRSLPLEEICARFEPHEVRVLLPRNDRGEAPCSEGLYDRVRSLPGISWGRLPGELLRLGKAADVKERRVHAKVYRFFDPKRAGREVLYVGSANLTSPGCRVSSRGGNRESGFLIEVTSNRRPDWWLDGDDQRPPAFSFRAEDEGSASSGGTHLVLRYHWDTHQGSAFWDDDNASQSLSVCHSGVLVLKRTGLPPRAWIDLDTPENDALKQHLASTSLFEVTGEGDEVAYLLVQEEGMHQRPSLLLELSAAEILRYWSLLSPEQRAAFIDAKARVTAEDEDAAGDPRVSPQSVESSIFDRFAGIFHAFSCLERHVREALQEKRPREADYRLFGKKYDSLGTLIERALKDHDAGDGDRIERYVLLLCAKQLLREVGRDYPEYWAAHRADVKALEADIDRGLGVRDSLTVDAKFIEWFERWFLKRARAVDEEATS